MYIRGSDESSVIDIVAPVTDAELEMLESERLLLKETEGDAATRIFKRSVVSAAKSIVELARFSSNERIRLQAAEYVVERVIGRVQDNPPAPPEDPFNALLAACTAEGNA